MKWETLSYSLDFSSSNMRPLSVPSKSLLASLNGVWGTYKWKWVRNNSVSENAYSHRVLFCTTFKCPNEIDIHLNLHNLCILVKASMKWKKPIRECHCSYNLCTNVKTCRNFAKQWTKKLEVNNCERCEKYSTLDLGFLADQSSEIYWQHKILERNMHKYVLCSS